jgi:thiol-disulfide isomerase/thioredoxin
MQYQHLNTPAEIDAWAASASVGNVTPSPMLLVLTSDSCSNCAAYKPVLQSWATTENKPRIVSIDIDSAAQRANWFPGITLHGEVRVPQTLVVLGPGQPPMLQPVDHKLTAVELDNLWSNLSFGSVAFAGGGTRKDEKGNVAPTATVSTAATAASPVPTPTGKDEKAPSSVPIRTGGAEPTLVTVLDLSDASADETAVRRVVDGHEHLVVLRYANWCGHCRTFKPRLARLRAAPGTLAVVQFPADDQERARAAALPFSVAGVLAEQGLPSWGMYTRGKLVEATAGAAPDDMLLAKLAALGIRAALAPEPASRPRLGGADAGAKQTPGAEAKAEIPPRFLQLVARAQARAPPQPLDVTYDPRVAGSMRAVGFARQIATMLPAQYAVRLHSRDAAPLTVRLGGSDKTTVVAETGAQALTLLEKLRDDAYIAEKRAGRL